MKYWLLFASLLMLAAVFSTTWANDDDDDDDDDSTEYGNLKVPGERDTTCPCGWANKEDQRIVGGEETKINEYPMMCGLYYKPKKILFCGGAIITEHIVLTAAHCLEPFEDDHVEDLQVVVGEHDQLKVDESDHTQYLDVKNILLHPEYYLVGHIHDIGVIVIEGKIIFSTFVGPACIPTASVLVAEIVKVLGWGKLSRAGPASNVLMKVNLNVLDLKECAKVYESIGLKEQRQVCTHHPTKDACQGDSGGPLLHLNKETNRYDLAALVSFGEDCAKGNPAVNTNVYYYLSWILKVIQEYAPGDKICQMK